MNKLIYIQAVTASYNTEIVLRDVSLTLWENDFLGIIGPNGGGKTTLLKVILGLLKPDQGQVFFFDNGQQISSMKISYLPQINHIDNQFPIYVYEIVASGLMSEKQKIRDFSVAQHQRIMDVITLIGLKGMHNRPINELSGGELQRVLLGRAIVSQPRVLILDEPNTYVDKFFESRLYKLLEDINKNTAVILVSHDVGTILPLVKNVACVNERLYYHEGNSLNENWLNEVFHCPVELVRHGEVPHRVLKKHHI